jgi:hypothetical protein
MKWAPVTHFRWTITELTTGGCSLTTGIQMGILSSPNGVGFLEFPSQWNTQLTAYPLSSSGADSQRAADRQAAHLGLMQPLGTPHPLLTALNHHPHPGTLAGSSAVARAADWGTHPFRNPSH